MSINLQEPALRQAQRAQEHTQQWRQKNQWWLHSRMGLWVTSEDARLLIKALFALVCILTLIGLMGVGAWAIVEALTIGTTQ